MKKKRILRWAALIGLVGFAVCLVAILVLEAKHGDIHRRRIEGRARLVDQLAKEYQAYLDETAATIKGLPADPHAVAQIQARHLRELPGRALYVWATTNDGQFSFGSPHDAFLRLNHAWDQFQATIARDNHYTTRDQFLRALLHERGRLTLEEPNDDGRHDGRRNEKEWWRFREPEQNDWDDRKHVLYLSSPIQDAKGQTVGSLNLKLVDQREDDATERAERDLREWEPVFAVPMVFCGFWLWFLLPGWVYVDAQERGMPRPLLWALLTLLGTVFALLVYLISRPAAPAELRCPKCEKALNGVKSGCPHCGADLTAAFCTQCQYPLKPEWAFCPACRAPITKTA
jgi:hypothetical protein